MSRNKPDIKSLIILHVILMIYSFGGVFSKLAAQEQFLSFKYLLFYGIVLLNLFFYALLWQQILKKMSVTVAYANKGVTILWGILTGRLIFNENISAVKVTGATLVMIGVLVVVTDNE